MAGMKNRDFILYAQLKQKLNHKNLFCKAKERFFFYIRRVVVKKFSYEIDKWKKTENAHHMKFFL